MKRILSLVVFTTTCLCFAHAQQDLNRTLGVRLSNQGALGISYKKYKGDYATELYLSRLTQTYFNTYELGYTKQYQFQFSELGGLRLYAGGGVALRWNQFGKDLSNIGTSGSVGIAAIGGVEYKIPKLPLVIDFSLMPTYNYYLGESFWARVYGYGYSASRGGGLSVRYTF